MLCMRELSIILYFGEEICVYKGNIMLVIIRRWVVFWDIFIGKEQKC